MCSSRSRGISQSPAVLHGSIFSNIEFQLANKVRIGGSNYPPVCLCGEGLDEYGNNSLKCRVGNEWNHRQSTIMHLIAYMTRSVQLIVQHEVPLSNMGPLRSLDGDGNGRMDLVLTYSDSQTLLADVTITHPAPI